MESEGMDQEGLLQDLYFEVHLISGRPPRISLIAFAAWIDSRALEQIAKHEF